MLKYIICRKCSFSISGLRKDEIICQRSEPVRIFEINNHIFEKLQNLKV